MSHVQIQMFIHKKFKILISTSTFIIRCINHNNMDIDLICGYKHCIIHINISQTNVFSTSVDNKEFHLNKQIQEPYGKLANTQKLVCQHPKDLTEKN